MKAYTLRTAADACKYVVVAALKGTARKQAYLGNIELSYELAIERRLPIGVSVNATIEWMEDRWIKVSVEADGYDPFAFEMEM